MVASLRSLFFFLDTERRRSNFWGYTEPKNSTNYYVGFIKAYVKNKAASHTMTKLQIQEVGNEMYIS